MNFPLIIQGRCYFCRRLNEHEFQKARVLIRWSGKRGFQCDNCFIVMCRYVLSSLCDDLVQIHWIHYINKGHREMSFRYSGGSTGGTGRCSGSAWGRWSTCPSRTLAWSRNSSVRKGNSPTGRPMTPGSCTKTCENGVTASARRMY